MTKTQKRALVLISCVVVVFAGLKVEQANAATLPQGTNWWCGVHAVPPYFSCHSRTQPGTTANLNEVANVDGAYVGALVAGLAGALCWEGGPIAIAVCTLVFGLDIAVILWDLHAATSQQRCFQANVNIPALASPSFQVTGGAHWVKRWYTFNGKTEQYYVWRRVNGCLVDTTWGAKYGPKCSQLPMPNLNLSGCPEYAGQIVG